MTSLRDVLQGIYNDRGRLTPTLVVTEARPEASPLHHRFEWDNDVAGDAYRREQAHHLIQSVRIRYAATPTGDRRDIRAFVAVPQADSAAPSYEPIRDVIADDFKRQLLLQEFERDWRTLKARYDALAEFSEVILQDIRRSAAA